MTYDLVEIFESLQGEGRNTGRPCVFVRFAGCNLACPWCDTDVTKRFSLELGELIREIKSFRAKSVVLTGGEPSIVPGMPELVAELKREGYWIAVETNGLKSPSWLQFIDYVAVSPKAEFASLYNGEDVLRLADEVRIVASKEDVDGFCEEMRRRIAAHDYYVSPCDKDGEIDFATAKSVLSRLDGWSLSVQLHKILGFR
jgi:organic radical activating enzyme